MFHHKYINSLFDLSNEDRYEKYILPSFEQDSSMVQSQLANTISIGKGHNDTDDEEDEKEQKDDSWTTRLNYTSLEDFGVSKCGFHIENN